MSLAQGLPVVDILGLRRRVQHRKEPVHVILLVHVGEHLDVTRNLAVDRPVLEHDEGRQMARGGLAALSSIGSLRPKQRRS